MKKISLLFFLAASLVSSIPTFAQQDKSKRASPPATVTHTNKNGATITIDYSKPSAKGRSIGKEIAPFGKVWRTGANEATTFEVSKDVKIEGKTLPQGKYSLYTIPGENEWTIIFNQTWKQWGTVYKLEDDVLRVTAKPTKAPSFTEAMTFNINDNGVTLLWADTQVFFKVQ